MQAQDPLRRHGHVVLAAILLAGCQIQAPGLDLPRVEAPAAEEQGEFHPNNLQSFLDSLKGERQTQAIAVRSIDPARSLLVKDLKVVNDPVRTAPGVHENVRKAFAVATCIGFHQSETGTFFLHVTNRAAGAEAGISSFVRNIELPARARDLANLL